MSVTMEDVARRAGVSKSTVSLVLNGRPGTSPEIQRVVRSAAESLGYELPRPRAVTVAERQTIALVHCTLDRPLVDDGTTRLFMAYQRGIRQALRDRETNLALIASYRDDDSDLGARLLDQPEQFLDGLILMGPGLFPHSRIVQQAQAVGVPLVVLGRYWSNVAVSSVSQDHARQADLALDYLADLGHSRIGFVARTQDRPTEWFRARLAAYRAHMARKGGADEAGIAVADDVVTAVAALLAQTPAPTALLSLNDHVAQLTIDALHAAGVRVPEDMAVVSIDGIMPPRPGQPALTTVAFPHEEVGRMAAQLLLQHIENPLLAFAHVVVQSQLIPGASAQELRAA